MWHVWERRGATAFRWENLMEKGELEDLGVNERIILKWISKTWDGTVWSGLICLRIGTDDGRW